MSKGIRRSGVMGDFGHGFAMISLDNGFEEAVGIVADARQSARRICSATGYQVVWDGLMPSAAKTLLGFDPMAKVTEVLIAHPDAKRGAIRLVDGSGTPASLLRDGAQAWDHGGIFDINIRAFDDLDRVHGAFSRAGFHSPAPVTDWDFGSLAVREVVERDADGICIAVMQRVHPPLEGYAGISGETSWVFNSTQIVQDFDAARRLFVEGLGWLPVQETDGFAAGLDGANCMGFPPGLASRIPMRIGIYHPHGRMEGSVEIIVFDCGGRDFSANRPPMRGWAGLRFAVSDMDGLAGRLAIAGCSEGPVVEFDWQPHGRFRAMCLTTPWGARFEILEAVA